MTNDYGNIELHRVLLAAMKDIDKICRENDLEYYIYAGTVLGAFNHNGFIPWDDDVDIVMFQKDFLELVEIIEKEYSGYYNIQTFANEREHYSKMSKFQIKGTKLVDIKGEEFPISIDISVLHSVPNNKIQQLLQRKQIEFINLALNVLSGEIVPSSILTKLTIKQYAKLGKERLGKQLDRVMARFDGKKTEFVGIMCNTLTSSPYTGRSGYESDFIRRESIENRIDLIFEEYPFMTFGNPEESLDWLYGTKWREPYPEEKRVTKHAVKTYFIEQKVRERVGL